MNTDTKPFKRGDRVTWNDPDGGTCSRTGRVTRIQYLKGIVFLTLDHQWTVEALPQEITAFPHPCASVSIRG